MKFSRNVSFSSQSVEIEEVQIEPEIVEEVLDEPEIIRFDLTEDELNAKLEEAFSNGFAEGSQAKEDELKSGIDEKITQLQSSLENFVHSEANFFTDTEDYIIKIASKISENIIHSELKETPEKIINMVSIALNKLKESRVITLFSAPIDFEVLESVDFHEKLKFSSEVEIKLLSKENLSRGSFYIESDMGNLYSIIEDQINDIQRQL